MNLFIGVMAMCLAKEQRCGTTVTPAVFLNQSQCHTFVAKTYPGKRVHCLEADTVDEAPRPVPAISELSAPKVEEVPIAKTHLTEILPAIVTPEPEELPADTVVIDLENP